MFRNNTSFLILSKRRLETIKKCLTLFYCNLATSSQWSWNSWQVLVNRAQLCHLYSLQLITATLCRQLLSKSWPNAVLQCSQWAWLGKKVLKFHHLLKLVWFYSEAVAYNRNFKDWFLIAIIHSCCSIAKSCW